MPSGRLHLIIVLLVGVSGASAVAQGDELRLSVGIPVENVISGSDPEQSYALYLPSNYDRDGSPPVLILMDPRGRAMTPLSLFRRASEDFGYVVLSSYRTLSDDPTAFDQNDKALNALLIDAQARFLADASRVYLVGFSGTAHYAWNVAPQLDGSLAGIVGVGGGLPAYSKPIQMGMAMEHSFAFYAVAGIRDFNYDGVRWLDEALDTTRVQHRFVTHEGRHQWPSEEIAYRAVEWFELQAMKRGDVAVDEAFVQDQYDASMDEAEEMRKSDDAASAFRRYREIVADFDQFGIAGKAEDRFEDLAFDSDVAEELRRRDVLSRRVQLYKLDVREFRSEYRETDPVMAHEDAVQRLKIPSLRKETNDRDHQISGAAFRMLASSFANTGFYEPRQYLQEGDFERAAGMLHIAHEILPDFPRTCYQLAQATAQLGRIEEAVDALKCAADADYVTSESIAADELLDPLKEHAGYRQLVE